MFNKEFIAGVMDLYGCNQIAVDREGKCFAMLPQGQFPIPDLVFDTTSADGTVLGEVLANAKGE